MNRPARPALNRSRYAILGALALRPMSGYDLRAFFARNLGFFWNESYGQIYPMLRALTAEGAVAPDADAATGRRKPYRITEYGRAELAAWLAAPVVHEVSRVEILLKLFFARFGEPSAFARHLAAFEAEHVARLAAYAAVEARLADELADRPDVAYWLAAVSYGRHLSDALLAWSAETRARLATRGAFPPTPDGDAEATGDRS